jgi:PAS domain S-box-containing protein
VTAVPRTIQGALAAGVLYLLTAVFTVWVSPGGSTIAFWPAAGIVVAALWLLPRSRWTVVLVLVAVGQAAANRVDGPIDVVDLVGQIAALVVGSIATVEILRRLIGTTDDRERLGSGVSQRFGGDTLALFAAAALGVALGALALVTIEWEDDSVEDFFQWWVGDVLGIVAIAPAAIAGIVWVKERRTPASLAEPLGWAAGSAILTVAVFSTDIFLVQLMLPLLLLAVLRVGARDSALAAAVFACLAGLMTIRGSGPFVDTARDDTVLVQVFVATIVAAYLGFGEANARLLTSRASRRSIERQLRAAVDANPSPFALVSPVKDDRDNVIDLRIDFANSAISRLIPEQLGPFEGRTLGELDVGISGRPFEVAEEVLQDGETRDLSFRLEPTRAQRTGVEWLRVQAIAVGGQLAFNLEDVTMTRRAALQLAASEERYRSIVETMQEGVGMITPTGRVLFVNEPMARLVAAAPDELVGTNMMDYVRADAHEVFLERWADLLAGRRTPSLETPVLHSDGSVVWADTNAGPVLDQMGSVASFVVVAADASDRRRAIDAKRELDGRIAEIEEEQRRRLAADLHDGPVQVLSALALRIGTLRRRLGAVLIDAAEELEVDEETVRRTVAELRRVMFDLDVPDLMERGLGPALRSSALNKLDDAEVTLHDPGGLVIDRTVATVLFRCGQEALQNIAKHANATHVAIYVEQDDEATSLRIVDDGVGVDPTTIGVLRPGHIGLRSVMDRARQLGGTASISSAPGVGTTVELSIPHPVETQL